MDHKFAVPGSHRLGSCRDAHRRLLRCLRRRAGDTGEGKTGVLETAQRQHSGGFLGGLLGGLPFSFFLTKQALSDIILSDGRSLLGLILLGVCIGLLVGITQMRLRQAWLRVEGGFRAGRELLLTKEETTIGRADHCDLELFGDSGVEKMHARIIFEQGRFFIEDENTPGGTFLNGLRVTRPIPLRTGDLIEMGRSALRFGERQKRPRDE